MSDENQVTLSEFKMEDIPMSCTWIIVGPPGSGKCLAPGTPILMYSGKIKKVEDIIPGDILLGDDDKPRNVLSVCSGRDQMYEIRQSRGMTYVVNEPHILSLYNPKTRDFIDVSVKEYLRDRDGMYKNYKGYRVGGYGNTRIPSDLEITPLGEGVYHGFEIDGNRRFLLEDGTVTHNTTFIENMCYYLKHRYPVGRVFIGTEGGYKHMCKIFHPLFVSNYYDEEEEKDHIRRQKLCSFENGDDYAGNYAINILDDVSDDPKIYKTKVMRGLFKLGSQHWKQLLMVGSQYAIDMPPDIRKSVSYVAMFFEPEEQELKKLYNNFGGLAGSYENFKDMMEQITGDHTCLIFKKRTQSHRIEDNIFWYKTKLLGDWKFGCREYQDWGKQRYDSKYTEQVIV